MGWHCGDQIHCVSSPPPVAWSPRPGAFALLYECTSGHSGDSVTEVTSAFSFCGGFLSDIFRANMLRAGDPVLRGPREVAGLKAHIPFNDISAEEHTEVWAVRENPQTTGQGWTWSGAEVRVLE